ncbi:hypothetical protein LDY25_11210 [Acinetobacter baumannii]|uniref:hypothetical protein n=1 Tax=Acinetobacter baumannii TaxID=470 RepID=UPI001CDC8E36|nr:hypothetical protein [Acinetobacter baumannii]MCA4422560.1 hypothetical protein [Acinetobacter baumannii]HAV2894216.1 hypothetical protein [Acinetobacter baumannii]
MVYLFALIFIGAAIAAIVGLIKPSLFKFKSDVVPNRWKVFGIFFLVSFVSLAFVGVFAPEVESSNNVSAEVKKDATEVQAATSKVDEQKPVADDKERNLGLTHEQFRASLNQKLKSVNISYLRPVAEFDLEKGEVNNTFNVMFTDAVGVVGTVSKSSDKVKEITILYGGQTDKDAADFLVVTGLIVQTLSPGKDTAPKELVPLMEKAVENKNETQTKVIDGKTYTVIDSDVLGLNIVISS